MATAEPSKRCSICGLIKPLNEFHRRRFHTRHGRRAACRRCTRQAEQAAQAHRRRRDDPEEQLKRRVRAKTRVAIKNGTLLVAPCRICGRRAEAHHPDYVGPDAHRRVDWLCKDHHALEHTANPRAGQLELDLQIRQAPL